MALLEMELVTGRVIGLTLFFQHETYMELLLGSPSKKGNDSIMTWLKKRARRIMGDYPVLVIDPDIETDEDGSERMPPVACIGHFDSSAIAESNDESCLTIIWFQNSIEPHISESNATRIRNVDWNRWAFDYEFDM